MNKKLTVQIATAILSGTYALRERGMIIPVRMKPGATKGSNDPHWGQGRLVGIRGSNLLIIPGKRHPREEGFPVDTVNLWYSKMNPEIFSVVRSVIKDQEDVLPDEIPLVKETVMPEVVPVEVLPEVSASEFDKEYNAYLELKRKLSEQARIGGIEKLRRLHQDRKDAIAMVAGVESDIIRLMSELGEFGVNIPSELVVATQTASVPAKTKRLKKPRDPNGMSPGWRPELANRHREAIGQFFKKHGYRWMKGTEIMEMTGEKLASPSIMLMPLVHDGTMERRGEKGNTEYRWKQKSTILLDTALRV